MNSYKIFFTICFGFGFLTTASSQDNTAITMSEQYSDTVKIITESLCKQTGAVSYVEEKDFNKSVCINTPLQLVQNKLTGLTMSIPNSSDPANSDIEFPIRGMNSTFGNNGVLYIIDGVPGTINSIAPQDIKSVSLLRDISSSNHYGTIASGPVFIIETKKASSNKLTVNYSSLLSISGPAKHADMLTAEDYAILNYTNDHGYNTDWFNEIMQTGASQQHNLSMSGGIKNIKFYGSLTYRDMQGEVKKSHNQEVIGLVNINANALNDRLSLNLSGRLNSSSSNPTDSEILEQTIKQNPTARPYDDNNNYTVDFTKYLYFNPVNLLFESNFENKINSDYIIGSAGFKIIDNWNIHTNISFSNNDARNSEFCSPDYQPLYVQGIDDSTVNSNRSKIESFYFDAYTDYSKTLGNHSFDIVGGLRYNQNKSKYNYINYRGNNRLYEGGDTTKYGNAVIFGKLSYCNNNKYLIDLSLSKSINTYLFNKKAIDPSVSVAWIISNENFLKNVTFINELRFRSGFGIKTLAMQGKLNEYYSHRKLNDEKLTELNIGIEWALLGNRLNGSVDYYIRKNSDILGGITYPDPMGGISYFYYNLYSLVNKGVEIGLQAIPVKTRDLIWTIYVNYSANKNKFFYHVDRTDFEIPDHFTYGFNDIYGGDMTMSYLLDNGHQLGNFYGLKSVDINENGQWIIETPEGERKNYTSISSFTDGRVIGNGIPKCYLGIANTLKYKKLDFSFNLRGAFGFQIINYQRLIFENQNISYNRLKSSTDLVYGKETLNSNITFVSYYVEDGDYLKIDNLSIGYTTKVNKVISSLRIGLSAQNVYTFTKYRGIDPEVSVNSYCPGLEQIGVYPSATIFSLGIDASF